MAQASGAQLRLRTVMGLLVVAAMLSACGDSGDAGSARTFPSGEVVLYTSMPAPIVERLELIFEGVFPDLEGRLWVAPGAESAGGMTLTVVRSPTGPLLDRIIREHRADGVAADVIWLAHPGAMEQLKTAGVLAPYEPPAGTPIPAAYRDPDGRYVAGRVINMVLAWNTDELPEGLTDWADLLQNHRSAFPGPRSGAALATVKALRDTFGEEFFRQAAASGVVQVNDNSAARDALVTGDQQAAVVLDYLVRQAQADGAPVDMSFPASGAVVIPSPLGITAAAVNPVAAAAFADFVLSGSGQRVLVEIGSFYPARSDVEPPPGAPPLASVPRLDVDWAELAGEEGELKALWREAFS